MFLTILIASLVIVALAVLGLGLNIFFRKNGRFPDTEVETNPNMRNLGLSCAKHDEMEAHRQKMNAKAGGSGKQVIPVRKDCGYGCSCGAVDEG